MRDVAEKAQVSIATVSRALRHDPAVNPKTRDRINAAAKELGYEPDPALNALNAYRERRAPKGFRGKLAWLTTYDTPRGWQSLDSNVALYEALVRYAPSCGYDLEPFWLHPEKMPAARLNQVLQSRGVRGLFIPSLPAGSDHVDFLWDDYCTVALSETVLNPRVHSVQRSTAFDVRTCVRELAAAGYRRPILAVHTRYHQGSHGLHEGAFIAATREFMSVTRPVFHTRRNQFAATLPDWVSKAKADSIISSLAEKEGLGGRNDLPPFVTFTGYTLPDETGIVHSMESLARIALDFLESMLRRGEYGIPENPIVLRVQGKWQAGKLQPKSQA